MCWCVHQHIGTSPWAWVVSPQVKWRLFAGSTALYRTIVPFLHCTLVVLSTNSTSPYQHINSGCKETCVYAGSFPKWPNRVWVILEFLFACGSPSKDVLSFFLKGFSGVCALPPPTLISPILAATPRHNQHINTSTHQHINTSTQCHQHIYTSNTSTHLHIYTSTQSSIHSHQHNVIINTHQSPQHLSTFFNYFPRLVSFHLIFSFDFQLRNICTEFCLPPSEFTVCLPLENL
jgi:hypothetical protein